VGANVHMLGWVAQIAGAGQERGRTPMATNGPAGSHALCCAPWLHLTPLLYVVSAHVLTSVGSAWPRYLDTLSHPSFLRSPQSVVSVPGLLHKTPITTPAPRMGILESLVCHVQWPVQWVLGTKKQAILGTHLSLFPALPCVLDQTRACNVCHSKNAETVVFFLSYWDICELCVRQARPNPFFEKRTPIGHRLFSRLVEV